MGLACFPVVPVYPHMQKQANGHTGKPIILIVTCPLVPCNGRRSGAH